MPSSQDTAEFYGVGQFFTERFSGVRGPNFTNLARTYGRSWP